MSRYARRREDRHHRHRKYGRSLRVPGTGKGPPRHRLESDARSVRRARCGRRRPGRLARRGGGGSGRCVGRAGGRRCRARCLPGRRGVLASLGPSAVFANVSTVAPSTIRRLADAGPAERILDSPVMGSPEMIAAGFGSFLIGGCPFGDHGRGTALDGSRLGLHALRAIRDGGHHEDRPEHAADHGRGGARRGHRHGPGERPRPRN